MVALVTGAGSDLGRAVTRRFAVDGYAVACVDSDLQAAERAVHEINALHCPSVAFCSDLSQPAAARRMVQACVDQLGGIDAFFANVDVRRIGGLREQSLQHWNDVIDANLTQVVFSAQAVAAHMVQQKRGRIVTLALSSTQGSRQGLAAHDVAKAGVLGLTRVMAVELGPSGVRANGIAWRARASDAACAVANHPCEAAASVVSFLASERSSFINGQVIDVNAPESTHAAG